jgi:hypothetical protein
VSAHVGNAEERGSNSCTVNCGPLMPVLARKAGSIGHLS